HLTQISAIFGSTPARTARCPTNPAAKIRTKETIAAAISSLGSALRESIVGWRIVLYGLYCISPLFELSMELEGFSQMTKHRELAVIGIATLTLIAAAGCTKKPPVAKDTPRTPEPTQTAPAPSRTEAPVQASAPAATRTPEPARTNYPDAATRKRIDELLARIEDAYFDYDKHTLRPDAIKALEADSTELRDIIVQYPSYKLTIEGHCDERGSAEYNMMLGQARAEAAKNYLVGVGIPGDQLGLVSYGKEKPACSTSDEGCWQKN